MVTFLENRTSSRSPIRGHAAVRLGNGITVEGKAVDVSLRGLMFVTENRLPIGKPVRVMLVVEGQEEPCRINAGGHIARLHDEGVAVQFTEMDADNAQFLRRLILLTEPTAPARAAAPRPRKN